MPQFVVKYLCWMNGGNGHLWSLIIFGCRLLLGFCPHPPHKLSKRNTVTLSLFYHTEPCWKCENLHKSMLERHFLLGPFEDLDFNNCDLPQIVQSKRLVPLNEFTNYLWSKEELKTNFSLDWTLLQIKNPSCSWPSRAGTAVREGANPKELLPWLSFLE